MLVPRSRFRTSMSRAVTRDYLRCALRMITTSATITAQPSQMGRIDRQYHATQSTCAATTGREGNT
eukprot:760862-Hanusia_phi.AAC.1